ncbi:MAG: hypothetical protein HYY03_07440 [Chloroflexi bacterium]|nr:hypothetical protein [Chloroflexota bacterium]
MATKTKSLRRRTWGLRLALYSALFLAGAVAVVAFVVFSGGDSDGGGTASRFTPIHTFDTADYHSLAFSPAEPGVVLFGHHHGIQMSEDGGQTWKKLLDEEVRDGMNLVFDPYSPGTIHMAGHDVYYRSDDGGETWQPVESNLPGLDLHAFAASPVQGGRLYAFAVGFGLFRSDDGGESWELLSSDVQAASIVELPDETLLVAAGDAGVLRSDDGGKTWTSSGAGLEAGVAFMVKGHPSGARLYAGSDDGLFVSTDGGQTWTQTSLDDTTALVVGVNPSDPMEVLVVDLNGQLYHSTDGGSTWG